MTKCTVPPFAKSQNVKTNCSGQTDAILLPDQAIEKKPNINNI